MAKSWKENMRKKYRNKWSSLFETLASQEDLSLATKTACIVWWDLWNAKDDFSGFRFYLDRYNKFHKTIQYSVDESDLENVLWKLGYPRKEARRRSMQPKTTRR